MERTIRLLLIVVIAAHKCGYSRATATALTTQARVNDILRDIHDTICHINYFEQAFLYLDFCAADGFSSCDESWYDPKDDFLTSLECNTKCPQQNDSDVMWNFHLLSMNYNITIVCHNNSCTGINEDTKLLKLEHDFTMINNTLTFHHDILYHDALVGCVVMNTDNCTDEEYQIIHYGEISGGDDKIVYPLNETTYHVALGENLITLCEADGDILTSLTWHKDQTSVIQSNQHCSNFSINNQTCISPSLDNYKKERVRSRMVRSQICEYHNLIRSTLDIAVADWTDNGSSYSCVSKDTDFSNSTTSEVHINVVVDVIPEFVQPPPSYTEHDETSAHSCVAKTGWDAKLQWFNPSGDVIPEHSPNDASLPSIYVTYSMNNVSTVLRGKNSSYTGDPINSSYPVHYATIHINGKPYEGQSRNFTCVINRMNTDFLNKYNVTNENLKCFMTVHINESSDSMGSHILAIIIGVIVVLSMSTVLLITLLLLLLCYRKCRLSRWKRLSTQAPFKRFTVEPATELKPVADNSKV